jgi:chromosome segregation ATPase
MIKLNAIKLLAGALTFGAILLSQTVFAQKYKTAADTVKLNKKYGETKEELAKLNSNLIELQNKTADYQSKVTSTTNDAVTAAQNSKETASTATDGSLSDAKKAMKQAKKADNKAKDEKEAKSDEANNVRKIAEINKEIGKKQAVLDDLVQQKADILNRLAASTSLKTN